MKRFFVLMIVVSMLFSLTSVFAEGTKEQAEDGFVIALSNSFYGNSWRKQMVDAFVEAAEDAKRAD